MTTVLEPRRAYRATDHRLLGGVCAGLAEHLGLPVLWVRTGLLVGVALGGLGLVLYAALWLLLPTRRRLVASTPGLYAATRQGRREAGDGWHWQDYGPLVAVGAVAAGVLLALGLVSGQALALGPLVIAGIGVALLWWQADQAQSDRWQGSSRGRIGPWRAVVGSGGAATYARLGVGFGLVVLAVALFALRGGLGAALEVGLAAAVALIGVGLVMAPWLVRLSSDLGEEREARVRSEERADVAAHLHDSVLQTLALIQRSSGDSAAVARLARSQERDLRRWLFESDEGGAATLASALRDVAAEVEEGSGVPVELVCVGDLDLSEATRPLVGATREAVLNAARHSGAPTVDVYAEAGPLGVEVFVRDRGRGFDPAAVAADRQGLRGSVVGRMERHGGTATVRSGPGEGTEVRLLLPVAEPAPAQTGSAASDHHPEETR